MADRFASVVDRLPRFDAALVLTASFAARRERYAKRAGNDLHDAFMLRDPVRFARVDSEILRLAVGKVGARLVDTSELDAAAHWSELCLLQKVCA